MSGIGMTFFVFITIIDRFKILF